MRTTALLAALMLAPTFAHAEEAETTTMNSKSLFVTGLVAVGAGGTALSVGGVLTALGAMIQQPVPQLACASPGPCPVFHSPPNPLVIAGVTLLGTGGAAIIAGIPMIVIGAKRVEMSPSGPEGSAGMSLRVRF